MMRQVVCRLVACCSAVAALAAAQPDRVSFNRDVRPIMSDTCFRCHGPDRNARMANMRLDIREEAIRPTRSGRIPIVPGDPDTSEIIARILAEGARTIPPPAAHKPLTAGQKETIRRWVAEGAVYEGRWAYQLVKRPAVPEVANRSRIRNPIDDFIQDRLANVNYDSMYRVLIPSAAAAVVCWMSALTKMNVGEAIRVANNFADAT